MSFRETKSFFFFFQVILTLLIYSSSGQTFFVCVQRKHCRPHSMFHCNEALAITLNFSLNTETIPNFPKFLYNINVTQIKIFLIVHENLSTTFLFFLNLLFPLKQTICYHNPFFQLDASIQIKN